MDDNLKIFPDDFINLRVGKKIVIPGKELMLGKEFFGSYEVSTTEGELVLNTENQSEAKFLVYSGKNKKGTITLPSKTEDTKKAVGKYESYLDELLSDIQSEFRERFPDSKNQFEISNEIFRKLNLVRL